MPGVGGRQVLFSHQELNEPNQTFGGFLINPHVNPTNATTSRLKDVGSGVETVETDHSPGLFAILPTSTIPSANPAWSVRRPASWTRSSGGEKINRFAVPARQPAPELIVVA